MNSTAKWIFYGYKRYHQSFLFTHMNRETQVWMKIIAYSFFSGQHFTMVTRDKVSLSYAAMTGVVLNFRALFKSTIEKARVYSERRYAFGGLITELYHRAVLLRKGLTTSPSLRPSHKIWQTLRSKTSLQDIFSPLRRGTIGMRSLWGTFSGLRCCITI